MKNLNPSEFEKSQSLMTWFQDWQIFAIVRKEHAQDPEIILLHLTSFLGGKVGRDREMLTSG